VPGSNGNKRPGGRHRIQDNDSAPFDRLSQASFSKVDYRSPTATLVRRSRVEVLNLGMAFQMPGNGLAQNPLAMPVDDANAFRPGDKSLIQELVYTFDRLI